MTDYPDDASGPLRAALLAQLGDAESACRGLHALLPRPGEWQGGAAWAFGRAVDGVRDRIDAALVAVETAQAEL